MFKNKDSSNLIHEDNIFLRQSDRTRFEFLLKGIKEESISLALSSDSEGVLTYYGRLLVKQLRKISDLKIEVFLPTDTDSLLERYNQILSNLSISEARESKNSSAIPRALIVHDAKAISSKDLELLLRLVQDFPGSKISLILFLDKEGNDLHEKILESFGQRLRRWPMEAPSQEEAEVLMKLGNSFGKEIEVKKVLSETGIIKINRLNQEKKAETISSLSQKITSNYVELNHNENNSKEFQSFESKTEPLILENNIISTHQVGNEIESLRTEPKLGNFKNNKVDKQEIENENEEQKISGLKILFRYLISAFLMLITTSTVIIFFVYPDIIDKIFKTQYAINKVKPFFNNIAIMTKNTHNAEALEEYSSELNKNPSLVIRSNVESNNDILKIEKENKSNSFLSDKTLDPLIDNQDNLNQKIKSLSESGVDKLIEKAKPESYFLQHVSVNSMIDAKEWREKYISLEKSFIAAVNTQEQGVKFAVLSGPFSNLKEAELFADNPGLPSEPWFRPSRSLQKALVKGKN